MLNKSFYILCLLALSACVSTQNVSWNVAVMEATLELPAGTQTAGLLNRVRIAYPYNANNSTIQNPNVPDIMNGAISGLRSQISVQKYLSIGNPVYDYVHTADGSFPEPLSLADLQQLAGGNDLLISLEMLDQYIADEYVVEIRRADLGNKTYREVDYFIGTRSVNLKLGWRVYDVNTGEILDEWEQAEDYFYEAESRERVRCTALLNQNYKRELNNLGDRYGRRYASRISPTRHMRTLHIYDAGSIALREGAAATRSEQWDEAMGIWVDGLKIEKKRKKRAMLYHNLAIYEERLGKNAKARDYAQMAANEHPLGVKTQSIVGFPQSPR